MDEVLTVFACEAQEKLDEMETGLLALEQGEQDSETLNAIFRAAHTIKGGAGVVEIGAIERFTHVLENLLDQLRDGLIDVTPELIGLVLAGCDHIRALLEHLPAVQAGEASELQEQGIGLAARLQERVVKFTGVAEDGQAETEAAMADEASERSDTDCWHVSVRFGRGVLCQGMEPIAFVRHLASLGTVRHLVTLFDAMPDADDMDPEACYLGFEIALADAPSQASIEQVFAFVRDDCELLVLPPKSPLTAYFALIASRPEESSRLADILVEAGAFTREQWAQAGAVPSPVSDEPATEPAAPAGNEAVEVAAGKDRKAPEARLLRVQADKLDRLIDLVGELVIAGSAAQLLARQSGQAALLEATAVLARLVEDVRDSSLQLRMVTIGETFNRFHRVVRDTARATGKEIVLDVKGGDTELDKSVVEKLADPLMHMVRNAIDHGIETADVRLANGKPAAGRVTLNAYHDSSSVVIEIGDDGGGLNADRIRAKAIERGLIEPGAVLSDPDVYNLIFEPGFSTAEQVTNLSGRGVGMDVVKKGITALRGSIVAQSRPGQGSSFTLRLPLTLAIIDGFMVSVAGASYVIPLANVVECVELRREETLGNVLQLRGAALPFLHLRELFEIEGEAPRRENVVVVQAGGLRAGIVVDQLQGEFQTVIKPLGTLFRHLRGVVGSTIVGSGDVALILDVQALASLATQQENAALRVN